MAGPSAVPHPQSSLFGDEWTQIEVGSTEDARLTNFNPRYFGVDFGTFKAPGPGAFFTHTNLQALERDWGVTSSGPLNRQILFVPPETGRAALHAEVQHPIYRDLLNKGVGLIERFTHDNKLRPASKGFDGLMEVSESTRDMINAEILRQAGVLVAEGLALVDSGQIQYRRDIPIRTGNYMRLFRVQTRISNLKELKPEDRKRAIDDAILQLQRISGATRPMNYVEYFQFMMQTMTRTAAIFQAVGFTQDSLHWGQFTLAGEVTDLGIGSFEKPGHRGVVNTTFPWFRYERQPLLIQNILFKTHSVKAEPAPIRLNTDSDTYRAQDSLFGLIRSFAPEAALEIERSQPEKTFWEQYDSTYRRFDVAAFRRDVLDKRSEFYDWDPERDVEGLPPETLRALESQYRLELEKASQGFDRPKAAWERLGLSALQKMQIFFDLVKRRQPELLSRLRARTAGWSHPQKNYLRSTNVNAERDLSDRPIEFGGRPWCSGVYGG